MVRFLFKKYSTFSKFAYAHLCNAPFSFVSFFGDVFPLSRWRVSSHSTARWDSKPVLHGEVCAISSSLDLSERPVDLDLGGFRGKNAVTLGSNQVFMSLYLSWRLNLYIYKYYGTWGTCGPLDTDRLQISPDPAIVASGAVVQKQLGGHGFPIPDLNENQAIPKTDSKTSSLPWYFFLLWWRHNVQC